MKTPQPIAEPEPVAAACGCRILSFEEVSDDHKAPLQQSGDRIRKIAELRETLAARFPQTHTPRHGNREVFSTGLSQCDQICDGGLPKGELVEIFGSIACGSLFLAALLETAAQRCCFAGLVDGCGAFDPKSISAAALSRVLWMRCKDIAQTTKATDLLLRDGSLPLLIIDLQMMPARALRKVPASTWYRFQRILEQSGASTCCMALTARTSLEAARTRIALEAPRFSLRAMRTRRQELTSRLAMSVRKRSSTRTEFSPQQICNVA